MYNKRIHKGFTLIELLVVIAIVALLMSILLPSLSKCKEVTKRIVCQSNLKQIMLGWSVFFVDNEDKIPRAVNVNHDFGGWEGTGGLAESRFLNPYLNLEPVITDQSQKTVFACPSDRGGMLGRPESQLAYTYFGNSYQTNIFLIGPTRLPGSNELFIALNQKYSRLGILRLSNITVPPYELLMMGDNNWLYQIDTSLPPGKDWHKKQSCFNMAFLDGHVECVEITEGDYVGDGYCVLPFSELHGLARQVQGE